MIDMDFPKRYFPKDRDEQGNAVGVSVPSYNRMGNDDSLMVQQAKQQAQNRQLQNQSLSPLAFSPYMAYMAHNSNSQPQDAWGAISKILDTYTASKLGGQGARNDVQHLAQEIANGGTPRVGALGLAQLGYLGGLPKAETAGGGLSNLSSPGASGQGLESLGQLAPYFAQYLGVRGF